MKKLILILLLTGCSFKSLVIPNLPYILSNRVDSSLHLYNDQEVQVKASFTKLLTEEKMRIEQIKSYFNQLNVKRLNVVHGYNFFAKNYFAIAIKVNRILAKQLATMDSNQIEKFEITMLEKNQDIFEQIQDRSADDYYKRYEYFFGTLSQSQKILIDSFTDTFKELSINRLEERKQTQIELLKALVIANAKEKEIKIISILDKTADRSVISSVRLKSLNQFEEFSQTLTPKQVAFFKERSVFLNEWVDEYLKTY